MQDYLESRVASGAKWTWSTLRCASCFYAPLQAVPPAIAQTWLLECTAPDQQGLTTLLFSCSPAQSDTGSGRHRLRFLAIFHLHLLSVLSCRIQVFEAV